MNRPATHRTIIRTLSQLDVSERLFVWGFRAIAQYHRLGWPNMTELQRVYDHFGVADAVPSLDAMIETFACTAHTAIELHCTGCPCLSSSEHLLLQAVASSQRGESELARRRFKYWLPEIAADYILGPACGLGRIFARSGLMLRLRHASAAPLPATMAMQTWPLGSPTLH
jgi:hypothetical protein